MVPRIKPLVKSSTKWFQTLQKHSDHLIFLEFHKGCFYSGRAYGFYSGKAYGFRLFSFREGIGDYLETWYFERYTRMRLRGQMPLVINNFLSDRSFKVRISHTLLDSHKQDVGVPQGSILSVTQFNVKINSIVNSVKDGVEKLLFVDDFAISCRSKTCTQSKDSCNYVSTKFRPGQITMGVSSHSPRLSVFIFAIKENFILTQICR